VLICISWIILLKCLLILSILILCKLICNQCSFILLNSLRLPLADSLRKVSISTHMSISVSIHLALSRRSRVRHRNILVSWISISHWRIFRRSFCVCKTSKRLICSAQFLISSHLIHICCIGGVK
jgi:hypothetical protein